LNFGENKIGAESQKARLSWERFIRIVDRFFPPIKVATPAASSPL
jgi:hypothetical protein